MNSDKKLEALKDLGLSYQEGQAYLTLLETNGSDATSLAKKLFIKRTTIYPILERLMEQNLVTTYEQSSKKIYRPVKPDRVALQFERKLESFIDIIPMLEKLQSKESGKIYGVKFIQSKKELKKIYAEVLQDYKNKEYYIIGSSSTWLNTDRDFFIDFRKRRSRNNTRVKLLLSHDSRNEIGQDDPSLLREYKYLPEKYNFKSTIDIYRDKIIIVGPEVDALCAVIAIPPMIDVFRSVFEILWENLN